MIEKSWNYTILGAVHLSAAVAKINKGFTELKLANCGFSAKGTAQLFHSMLLNQNNFNTLTKIDLSGNNLKDDINVRCFSRHWCLYGQMIPTFSKAFFNIMYL
jgi:Ran GTPase-activating protein (RanGAP) involved in mRNA processing and transport